EPFLRGLAELLSRRPELKSRLNATFVGIFPSGAHELVEALGLGSVVQVMPYQRHREAMRRVMDADIAWVTVGDGPGQESISTGKLFAYMGAAKPILGIVPEGAAKQSLEAYGASWTVHPGDVSGLAETLSRIVDLRDRGNLPVPNPETVAAHDRRALAGQLAGVLDRATS
ncbi:MAG: glycosyl transferase family 1, partial [Rhodothermales bacterium]|nr:glycosyl transferase family 1 [Rhodothermales bacterium]